jgi:hypothetical protein
MGLALVFAAVLGAGMPTAPSEAAADNLSLRFFGTGRDDIDRVKIRLDDPARPVDVGKRSFTIELWVRARATDNPAPAVTCGADDSWIRGNILLDRDRYNRGRKFGLSIAGGVVAWGVTGPGTGARTICGATVITDGAWHHVAVSRRRSDGWLRIWVDGRLDASADGPDGDVSYPDGSVGGSYCDGVCRNDPFLVIGAEKHDAGPEYPSFAGWVDELRVSRGIRYTTAFTPRTSRFRPDDDTRALYHFDEGSGTVIRDSSGASGGPSNGVRKVGGPDNGPRYSTSVPFP